MQVYMLFGKSLAVPLLVFKPVISFLRDNIDMVLIDMKRKEKKKEKPFENLGLMDAFLQSMPISM